MLAFCGTVSDFTLTADPQSSLQGVMRLALVETDIRATLHFCIEQPFDDEQRPFNPPDFAQGKRQGMLLRARRQFPEEMAGLHSAGEHGCDAAQNIGPIGDDRVFADLIAGKALEFHWDDARFKDMQPLRREIADARAEQVPQQRRDRKDQVGEASGIGVLPGRIRSSVVSRSRPMD